VKERANNLQKPRPSPHNLCSSLHAPYLLTASLPCSLEVRMHKIAYFQLDQTALLSTFTITNHPPSDIDYRPPYHLLRVWTSQPLSIHPCPGQSTPSSTPLPTPLKPTPTPASALNLSSPITLPRPHSPSPAGHDPFKPGSTSEVFVSRMCTSFIVI
jgi:hypothetical protein